MRKIAKERVQETDLSRADETREREKKGRKRFERKRGRREVPKSKSLGKFRQNPITKMTPQQIGA